MIPIPIPIVHRDAELLVVNKPSGLPTTSPDGGDCLVSRVRELDPVAPRLQPTSRLDARGGLGGERRLAEARHFDPHDPRAVRREHRREPAEVARAAREAVDQQERRRFGMPSVGGAVVDVRKDPIVRQAREIAIGGRGRRGRGHGLVTFSWFVGRRLAPEVAGSGGAAESTTRGVVHGVTRSGSHLFRSDQRLAARLKKNKPIVDATPIAAKTYQMRCGS